MVLILEEIMPYWIGLGRIVQKIYFFNYYFYFYFYFYYYWTIIGLFNIFTYLFWATKVSVIIMVIVGGRRC